MAGDDEALADEEVIGVLRQQLPPQLQGVESVEELLEYGIAGAKAERDAAIDNFVRTKQLMSNIKLLSQLEEGTRAYVDAGSRILLPARLQDKQILVHIGHQFHVAMEPAEAEAFSAQRLELVQRSIDNLNVKVAKQRAQAFIIAETLSTMSAAETG